MAGDESEAPDRRASRVTHSYSQTPQGVGFEANFVVDMR
jgi:hypothetical protein